MGQAFANALAARGWNLVLADIQGDRLAQVAAPLAERGPGRVHTAVANVASSEDVGRMVDSLQGTVQGLDLLINCAGILGAGWFPEQSMEAFGRVVQVNLMGTIHVIHAVLPWLRRARGQVVNLASTASLHGWPALAAYSASKGAIENFAEAIRPELARDGIGITTVFPLLVDTPMLQQTDLPPILQGRRVSAEDVVRKTLRAAERRRRRVYVPWTVRFIALVHGLAPRLLDWWGARFGMPANNVAGRDSTRP